jgi:hypothetical protein
MITLIDILKEILEGKAIEVPEEEIKKIDGLYSYITSNLEKIKEKSTTSYIDPKFKNYFTITPIGKSPIKVSVEFKNDPKDFAAGRGTKAFTKGIDLDKKNISLNIAHFASISDKEDFEELIRHELIHAIDPKTSRSDLYTKTAAKADKHRKFNVAQAKNPNVKFAKYFQTPEEFEAEAGTIIGTIKKNLNSIEDSNQKEAYKKLILKFPQDLKDKNVEDIVNMDNYKDTMRWLLSSPGDKIIQRATIIQGWMENPDFTKKFLSKLANTVSSVK